MRKLLYVANKLSTLADGSVRRMDMYVEVPPEALATPATLGKWAAARRLDDAAMGDANRLFSTLGPLVASIPDAPGVLVGPDGEKTTVPLRSMSPDLLDVDGIPALRSYTPTKGKNAGTPSEAIDRDLSLNLVVDAETADRVVEGVTYHNVISVSAVTWYRHGIPGLGHGKAPRARAAVVASDA